MINTGNVALTANQITILQTIAYKHFTIAAGMARTMLVEYGEDWLDEELINPMVKKSILIPIILFKSILKSNTFKQEFTTKR